MGRKKTDYSKIVIYKIVCNDKNITDFYVGYTSNYSVKIYIHKIESYDNLTDVKTKNKKLHKLLNDNGGWNNFTTSKIEDYSCNNSVEARERVKYWENELAINGNNDVEDNKNYELLLKKYNKLMDKYWNSKVNNKYKLLKEKYKILEKHNNKMKNLLLNQAFLDNN
jgi:hypothetical protein